MSTKKGTTRHRPLTDFAGLLTEKEAAKVEAVIREGRARSRARAKRLARLFKQ